MCLLFLSGDFRLLKTVGDLYENICLLRRRMIKKLFIALVLSYFINCSLAAMSTSQTDEHRIVDKVKAQEDSQSEQTEVEITEDPALPDKMSIPGIPGGRWGTLGVVTLGVAILGGAAYGTKQWATLRYRARQLRNETFDQNWSRGFMNIVADVSIKWPDFESFWANNVHTKCNPYLMLDKQDFLVLLTKEQEDAYILVLEQYRDFRYRNGALEIIKNADLVEAAIKNPQSDQFDDREKLSLREVSTRYGLSRSEKGHVSYQRYG